MNKNELQFIIFLNIFLNYNIYNIDKTLIDKKILVFLFQYLQVIFLNIFENKIYININLKIHRF